ncbi:cytochrome c biogenesis protein CcdA [Staphylococcus hominis]
MVIYILCAILMVIALGSLFRDLGNRNKNKRLDILSSVLVLISAILLLIYGIVIN